MGSKVAAVRRALYLCFPDQGQNEVNSLVETDKGINYALAVFDADEVVERAMLMMLHYAASVPVSGFLYVTNHRLLFAAAVKALKPHPFYRKIAYSEVQRVMFERSRWFHVAQLTLVVTGVTEPLIFESIIKNEVLQGFVDYLENKIANPDAPVPDDEIAESPGDFVRELERLSRLNAEGALADAEFDAAKKKLLGL